MKLRTLILGMALGATTMLFTSSVVSMNLSTDSDDDLRHAFKQIGAQNEFLAKLKPLRGKYVQDLKWWRSADAEPVALQGRTDTNWLLESRFVKQQFDSKWLGMKFEATLILGYDAVAQHYTSVWMDTLGSRMIFSKGKLDESGETITFIGEYTDALTREPVTVRTVMQIPSKKDNTTVEMFRKGADGKEYKCLEVTNARFIPRGA